MINKNDFLETIEFETPEILTEETVLELTNGKEDNENE